MLERARLGAQVAAGDVPGDGVEEVRTIDRGVAGDGA